MICINNVVMCCHHPAASFFQKDGQFIMFYCHKCGNKLIPHNARLDALGQVNIDFKVVRHGT